MKISYILDLKVISMPVIAVSGSPGTGKTEVAMALAKRLDWKLIGLNRLAAQKGLYSGYDRKRKCKIVDIGGLAKEIEKLAKTTENMVLESHYAHDMPCDFVVILRTNPRELRKRMEAKGWDREKIEENVEAEVMEICKTEALEQGKKIFEFDTTNKKPGKVVREIIRILRLKTKDKLVK
jgi:adenylate kinase